MKDTDAPSAKKIQEAKDAISERRVKERELLLQLLNCYAPDAAQKLTEEILKRYKSLYFLCEMPGEELAKEISDIPGMPEDAVMLFACLHVILRQMRMSRVADMQLNSLCNAREYVLSQLFLEKKELALAFLLDAEYRVIERREINDGGADKVEFDFNEMADSAMQKGAKFALIAHNHPAGGKISLQDDAATKQALCALSVLGIPLLDHLVIVMGCAESVRESGRLEESLWLGQAAHMPSRDVWLAVPIGSESSGAVKKT